MFGLAATVFAQNIQQWQPYLIRASYLMFHRKTWGDFEHNHINATTWQEAAQTNALAWTWGDLESTRTLP